MRHGLLQRIPHHGVASGNYISSLGCFLIREPSPSNKSSQLSFKREEIRFRAHGFGLA